MQLLVCARKMSDYILLFYMGVISYAWIWASLLNLFLAKKVLTKPNV